MDVPVLNSTLSDTVRAKHRSEAVCRLSMAVLQEKVPGLSTPLCPCVKHSQFSVTLGCSNMATVYVLPPDLSARANRLWMSILFCLETGYCYVAKVRPPTLYQYITKDGLLLKVS